MSEMPDLSPLIESAAFWVEAKAWTLIIWNAVGVLGALTAVGLMCAFIRVLSKTKLR